MISIPNKNNKVEKPVSHKHTTVSQKFFFLHHDRLLAHLDPRGPSTLLFEDALQALTMTATLTASYKTAISCMHESIKLNAKTR